MQEALIVAGTGAANGGVTAECLLGSDMRQVVRAFQAEGELRHADGASWDMELGAITELMALRDGPALLFDDVQGYPHGYRVLANMINSPRRVALLAGLPTTAHPLAIVRALQDRLGAVRPIDTLEVSDSPVFEHVQRGEEVDLWQFPTPRWHEHDGGRFLGTACAVITKEREGAWVNAGTYRAQVHNRNMVGLYVQRSHHAALIQREYWEHGEACPVAICIGVPPALLMGAFLTLPQGLTEYRWAGGIMGRPLEVFRGEVTGLPLPATAEIVLEGFCPPPTEQQHMEGPFGETIGYYASGAREEPVVNVQQVYHRTDPILVGAPPLRPPASSSASYLFRSANTWTNIERAGVPGVQGVWMHPSGASSMIAIVSIKQRYTGHPMQAGITALSGSASSQLGRFVIVVDEDIDPSDIQQVLWAVATRCDPAASITILKEMTTPDLDPRLSPEQRANGDFTGSRAIINACRPYTWRDQFPRTVEVSQGLREQVLKDWPQLFSGRI